MINSKIKWVAREYETNDEYQDGLVMQVAETEVTGYIDSELYTYIDKMLEDYLDDAHSGTSCHYIKRTYFDSGFAYAKVYSYDNELVTKLEVVKVNSVDIDDLKLNYIISSIIKENNNGEENS